MAKRKNMTSVPNERTRKQKKARYISLRNKMLKYPDCAYNGDFFCNHVYDPADPWLWVDFSFYHTTEKRYFACAMVTAEYEAYHTIEDKAIEIAYTLFPTPDVPARLDDMLDELNSQGAKAERNKARDDVMSAVIREELEKPSFVVPSITVKDYGPVAVGLWVTVNKPHINEHIIREFIADFRALGEPVTPGWYWHGEETQVDCRRLFGTRAS